MSDVHSKEKRSYNMSRIRGKNTRPELNLRKKLWRRGLRYRLKSKLPGKPDIVFHGKRLVIFVDGCFWHKCPNHFQPPKANAAFWRNKIEANVRRDQQVNMELQALGWTVLRFWEHELKTDIETIASTISQALNRHHP